MKMRQPGNPKAGVNGKKITTMRMDITKEGEELKVRTREKKAMDLNKIKEAQTDGKGEANYVNPSHFSPQPSWQQAALPLSANGSSFHTENQTPPTVASLDLGWTRSMGSKNATKAAFCEYVDQHDRILSFTCISRHGMRLPLLDIVEQGNVPLQMSLAEMRNLGFQFELLPPQSCLHCARLGMWKYQLRMSQGIHVVMDFQDMAWRKNRY